MKHRASAASESRASCPHPRKRAYADRKTAEFYAVAGDTTLRPYLCHCGAWHLTKHQYPDLLKRKPK